MNVIVRQIKLTLIIAITNLILSVYYLFIGLRLSALYSQFNVATPNPFLNNKYFLIFVIFTLLSFVYWYFLRNKVNKGIGVNIKIYNLILLFLTSPIIYLAFTFIYSLIIIHIIVPRSI
ncbi:hypothetical protein A2Z22_03895 [Candidatus Woesebacteria bacterium RBG_16_34_12]|uniref:Uncharacterized protein n=1 Tax=Candidatus Woesebacteria bacterium RBG_16_34_12 TaxID=1802480 RepID=A0A1F7X7U6_9BACT|nr:MAG: hypothetical protein A2Z22_03895 [Candidatus Woesebacteria bacterium RBG_16_34_12]